MRKVILFCSCWGVAAACAGAPEISATKYDPLMAEKSAVTDDQGVKWIDGRTLPLEGRAFDDVEDFYDRLPAGVTTNVNSGVRAMKHHSTGLQFRFRTTSPFLSFQWTPRSSSLAMTHMPATGVSGIDVYQQLPDGSWEWVKTGFPKWPTGTLERITQIKPLTPVCVNLPLYNGIHSFRLGVAADAQVEALGPRKSGIDRPVVFYGTSITHGGCASRPGMAFPAILGRALDVPVVNLGFSGSGVMEREMADHLARVDASCYVLDCLPNMGLTPPPPSWKGYRHKGYMANYEPFIRALRAQRPDVPIVMAEQADAHDRPDSPKNAIIRKLYAKLVAEGWKNLVYLPAKGMMPADGEGTVDGSHPNDYGMMQLARVYGEAVRKALSARAVAVPGAH